ncbi:MAG: outer membrane beta-barrel protein [Tannerella sp.]|nr:outer membrane beta-barrel protein [Tannerella sp.]
MQAQTSVIKGTVADIHQKPIFPANILLYDLNDSTQIIKTASTDINGRFVLSQIPVGNYKLSVSCIGYDRIQIHIENLLQNINSLQIVMLEKAIELDEVTVMADNIIHKFDRQIIFPNEFEKNNSIGGVELIEKMNLNRIVINRENNTIKGLLDGIVQLRINGAPADFANVQAIDPKLVTRIEYHDMPSMRYGEVEAVIDMYVKRRESGGSTSLFTYNSVTSEVGNESVNIKLNHLKSEFNLEGGHSYTHFKKNYSTNKSVFNFEDGTALTRYADGIPSKYYEDMYNARMSYSYYDPDNILFVAKLSYIFFDIPISIGKSHLYTDKQPEILINKIDSTIYHDKKPSFSLYFQKNLRDKQFVAFDIVGTYLNVKSIDSYHETQETIAVTDIYSDVNGEKYSVIAEGIYEKRFDKGKISAGLKQNLSFSDNEYRGSLIYDSKMNQYLTNGYLEWSAKINRVNYAIGIRGTFIQMRQETGNDSYVRFNPSLKLGYMFSGNAQIRYQSKMSIGIPSLGQLSNVEQVEDSYHIRRGNPNLKPASSYSNLLTFTFDKGNFSSSLDVNDIYVARPMLRNTFREDGKFITQMQNAKNAHSVYVLGSVRWSAFNRRLSVYARGGYRYNKNTADDYSHSLNCWYGTFGASGTYKDLTLSGEVRKEADLLSGERITYRGQSAQLGIDYKWKDIKVGGTMGWDLRSFANRILNLNRYASSDSRIYMPEGQTYLRLKVSWNFSFGRKHSSGYKRIENSDEGSGILL